MNTPTILLTAAALAALTACGAPHSPPQPEASICARTADHVRVENTECAPGSPAVIAGTVRWHDADTACLDGDDYTQIGVVADDDYLEGCDEAGHAKAAKKTTTKTTTKKSPVTTTKKRAIARPTS